IRTRQMKHLLYINHVIHDLRLPNVSGNSVEYQRIDVRFEFMSFYSCIDRLSPKLHCDVVRNQLPLARIFEEGFADFCARVDGTEYVAAGAMIVTRNRAERFALCAFAAARRAKKNEGVVSHHDKSVYTATPVR